LLAINGRVRIERYMAVRRQ